MIYINVTLRKVIGDFSGFNKVNGKLSEINVEFIF